MSAVPPAAAPDAALAFAAARAICRRHARSFYFASKFLPIAKRQAAYAVYAYCRMIDDAIDADDDAIEGPRPVAPSACGATSPLDRRLQLFRDRLDEIYAGTLALPPAGERNELEHTLHAFALTVHQYEIPKQHFVELAEGCRMDLTINRYATWASLERYCYRVAGVVGLIMSGVFGLANDAAREQAVLMGNAMQLTNILRDVREDWERGRIYLPLEDLARFGYAERDLAAGVVDERFRALMRFEIERARDLFRRGSDGLCHLANDGSRLTASSMAVIYAGILNAIERQGYDVFRARASLSTIRKVGRLPRAWRLSRREAGEPLPDVFA